MQQPLTLSLDDLKARPREEVTFTLECSGNDGLPFFNAGIGNATWAGTPLAPVLQEAGLLEQGIEIVFFGSDMGVEEVRQIKMPQHFARSLVPADALDPRNLLCYEMNGEPLPQAHGFPVRLIVPGWYGIANVKWLQRIEVLSTRYESRFMARDYVTPVSDHRRRLGRSHRRSGGPDRRRALAAGHDRGGRGRRACLEVVVTRVGQRGRGRARHHLSRH